MLRQYELVERVKGYDPDADEAMLNRAYVYTVQKHGSLRKKLYFAYSTARLSRMTLTLIWPG